MRGWSHTIIFKIVFVSLFFTSCNYKNQKLGSGDVGPVNLSSDALITDELVMTYSLRTCQSCHAGAQKPSLDSVAAVRANITKVLSEVAGGDMPPAATGTPPLTACQKALVKNWANATAQRAGEIAECKNAAPGTTPELPVVPIELMPLNYDTLKTKILLPKCVICHNVEGRKGEEKAARILFVPYAQIKFGTSAKMWKAPAQKSKVYDEVTYHFGQEDDGMPPNDSGMKKLTTEEIDFIARWIDAGKPEK